MHMTLLGALLALAPRRLYVHADGFAGLTPLADQDLGGAIMLLMGGVSYLLGGLGLMAGFAEKETGGNKQGQPKRLPVTAMNHIPRCTAVILAGLAIGAFLIAASGIVPNQSQLRTLGNH